MINAQKRVGKANYIAEAIRSHEKGNNVVDMNAIFNLVSSLKQDSGLMINPKAPVDTTIDNKGVQNIASDLVSFRNKR